LALKRFNPFKQGIVHKSKRRWKSSEQQRQGFNPFKQGIVHKLLRKKKKKKQLHLKSFNPFKQGIVHKYWLYHAIRRKTYRFNPFKQGIVHKYNGTSEYNEGELLPVSILLSKVSFINN